MEKLNFNQGLKELSQVKFQENWAVYRQASMSRNNRTGTELQSLQILEWSDSQYKMIVFHMFKEIKDKFEHNKRIRYFKE